MVAGCVVWFKVWLVGFGVGDWLWLWFMYLDGCGLVLVL